METFVAVSADGQIRWYGYGKGAGHALMIPDGFFGDPLSGADGSTVCGKSLDVSRLTEKSQGEVQCKACAKRLTDELINAARVAMDALRDFCAPVAMEEGPGGIPVAVETVNRAPAGTAALDEKTATSKGSGAPVTGGGSAFVTVGGKCAREVAGENGAVSLKAIHGKAKIAPVEGSLSVNGDGAEVGVCPQCHREVKLTGSGFIGTHYPAKLEKSPLMSERSVADVVADAAERRRAAEIDAERAAATEEGREFRAPVAENAGRSSGDQGTEATRGAALVQGADMPPVQPKSGHASTWDGGIGAARPDRKVTDEPRHGGRYGYFTKAEYSALSRTAQRAYWRNVRKFEIQAKAARKAITAKSVAVGEAIPRAERSKRKKAAKVGSSVAGHVIQNHPGVGHGETAEGSRSAA